jgi:hypothetical protein
MDDSIHLRRKTMLRWLGIELTAYVLLGILLVTEAWANSQVSGLVVLVLWVLVGCALALWVRGLYRKLRRSQPAD